jgi:SagB-type dehydrogenase family enzyme
VRRATCLIGWLGDAGELVLENYLTGRRSAVDARVIPPLQSLTDATPWPRAVERFRGLQDLLTQLLEQHVVLPVGGRLDRDESAVLDAWPWDRDAHYFHWSTRRTAFTFDVSDERRMLLERARTTPQPPAYTYYAGRPETVLPPAEPNDTTLANALSGRRTRRDFASQPMSLQDLATVLGVTWGVSSLRSDPGVGVVALKTSPSGGARHPTEAYCLPLRVTGLERGVYHYCAGRHSLSLISRGVDEDIALAALAGQSWALDAAAVFFMTSVTRRSAWKYRQSHAYRVVLLDAGHLGQTFHLVCTALGLGPWTSAALDETQAERLLALKDRSEIVVYTAACGTARG